MKGGWGVRESEWTSQTEVKGGWTALWFVWTTSGDLGLGHGHPSEAGLGAGRPRFRNKTKRPSPEVFWESELQRRVLMKLLCY